jgi:hypothetical protein
MSYSATLTPPVGKLQTTQLQGKSGYTYEIASDGSCVVLDAGDAKDLISQGWVMTSVSGE